MPIIKFEDYLKAIDEASKVFGVDPAYFGEEGDREVEKQLKKIGYTDEELEKSKARAENKDR